jgi:uncharacterized membrane protein YjgN (DUF898 family)
MLWIIFFVLVVLWALAIVSSSTMGGYIHILLLAAIIIAIIRVIRYKNPLE